VGYDAGSSGTSITTGDLDSDGDLDLAVTYYSSHAVSILLGNGDGTFKGAVIYGTGNYISYVTTGDLDRDDDLDLMVTHHTGDAVSILLGNGDGTFQNAVSYDAGERPESVTADDLDNDGDLDLAVANRWSDDVSIFLGNGDGTFQDAVSYDAGGSSITAGDLDGDGALDLACSGGFILLGNGDGTFQDAVGYDAGSGGTSITTGDLDGDGTFDLAITHNFNDDVSILLGNGDGTFHDAMDYYAGYGPSSVTAGDLDGDGDLDLAVANSKSNDLSILYNMKKITFNEIPYLVTAPLALIESDLDLDGFDDIVVTNHEGVYLFQNNGDETFSLINDDAIVVGENPVAIASDDFNDDDYPDLAVANRDDNTLCILLSNPATKQGDSFPTFEAPDFYDVGVAPTDIAVTYLDDPDDGHVVSLIVSHYGDGVTAGTVGVMYGKMDGTFKAPYMYETGLGTSALEAAWFDDPDDGHVVSLIVANKVSGTVGIYYAYNPIPDTNPAFKEAVSYSVGAEPADVAVVYGGEAREGEIGIATANESDDSISFLRAIEGGGFEEAAAYPVGDRPTSLVFGAFDVAEKRIVTGLAVSNRGDDSIAILLEDGEGGFQAPLFYYVGKAPAKIVSSDFNLDSLDDIAMVGGDGLSVWFNKTLCPDDDDDGFQDVACGKSDCDDTDPHIYPGAEEDCEDGIDNDCDGLVDSVDEECDCIDNDGDGFGYPGNPKCDNGSEEDCNDCDPTTYPGAPERCDLKDNNCNCRVDEGPCLLIEALALLGLAGRLMDCEDPPPEPHGEEDAGGGGGCGCAHYRGPVRSGLTSSALVYLLPVLFVGILKFHMRRECYF